MRSNQLELFRARPTFVPHEKGIPLRGYRHAPDLPLLPCHRVEIVLFDFEDG